MTDMHILIGAGSQKYPGWIATQKEELDLLSRASFERYFGSRRANSFVGEHVWEHLTEEEGRAAARLCFDYLADGAVMTVAVPDGNFPNEEYQRIVQIGGPGPVDHPAADHKIVYKLPLLFDVFESAGFVVDPLEYCDEAGRFHYHDWNWHAGPIYRSLRTDDRNKNLQLGFVSLIIEARKPKRPEPTPGSITPAARAPIAPPADAVHR
jgi:predicted SAM-dependent methyltransferase